MGQNKEVRHFSLRVRDDIAGMPQEAVRAAYNQLHSRHAFRAISGYYDWLLSLAYPKSGERLLDVGCGSGPMLRSGRAKGLAVAGVDISDVAIAQARAALPEADLHIAPGEKLPFGDGSFDIVTCVGSLEHLLDPLAGLKEMRRVAKPKARVVLIVPNRRYVFAWFTLLRQKLIPSQGQPLERLARQEEWQELISASGLEVIRLYKDNNVYLGSLLQWASRMMNALTPLKLCYQFVFVATPKQT